MDGRGQEFEKFREKVVRFPPFLLGAQLPLAGAQSSISLGTFGPLRSTSRLRNFGNRSDEFCFCKLITSTCAGQIGTIHT